jgi:hypothetical protein
MNFLAKIDSKRIDAAGDVNITAGALSITTDGSNKATLTESGSGDFEIHAADDLRLNADGQDIVLKGASTEFGRLSNSSGNFIIQNITSSKDIIFQADDGSGSVTAYLTLDGSAQNISISKNTTHGDDIKSYWGDSNDLQLYHDSNNSYIVDNGSGNLIIAGTQVYITNAAGSEYKAQFTTDGAVNLYYDNSKKFETTSTGVTASGTRSIFAADTIVNSFSGTAAVEVYANASDSVLMVHQDDGNHESILHFRTGGNDTKIIVPANTNALQIDTESVSSALTIANTTGNVTLAGQLDVTGKVVTTEIESSGVIVLDAAGDITLDADGADIVFKDGGTEFGRLTNDSQDLEIKVSTNDKDFKVNGYDNSVEITAFRLDMSDSGWAHFNSGIAVGGGVSAISTFEGTVDVNGAVSTFGAGGTGTGDAVVSIDGGSGTGGEAYLRLTRGGTSGFILNHTASSIEHRATANIPQRFYTNDTLALTLDTSQNALFSGKVQFESASDYIDVISSDLYIIAAQKNIIYSGGLETIRLETTGQVEFDKYGAQTFTGTSASYLIATSSGDIIEKTPAQVRSDIGAGTGSGSVTSVAVTVGTGLDVSGSPITSSGTIDIDLDLTEITVGAGLDTTATGISLDLSELSSATGAMGSSDRFILSSSGGSNRKSTPNLIGLSLFDNDAGFTTNSGTVTGTGSSNRIAIWNSSTGLTSDSDLQWNSTSNKLIFESDYSISDNNGDFELNHDDSDINTTLKGFGGNGALKIQENSIFTSASGFYVPSGYGISAGTTATASGTIRATGNIVAYYSDERLKDFKGNIPDALDKVCQLNGYYYTQNDKAAELGYENYERQVGVSAQEVEKVMPEVVETAPISYDNEDDYLTVDYGRLVPLLIESIKELKNEIEILKNKSCGN